MKRERGPSITGPYDVDLLAKRKVRRKRGGTDSIHGTRGREFLNRDVSARKRGREKTDF